MRSPSAAPGSLPTRGAGHLALPNCINALSIPAGEIRPWGTSADGRWPKPAEAV
jgi:hypothetical protein